jgi:hypothetical protein
MDPSAALADACFRQSENCAYTATSFTIWLRLLRWTRTICSVAPVIFGGLATWKIVGQSSPTWAAVFTFLATIIPVTYRAMKIDQSIAEYTTATGEYTNLRDRFRMAAEMNSQKPLAEFETVTKPLFDRLEKIRACALTPPEWCFKVARQKHKDGHYTHDYDVPRTPA